MVTIRLALVVVVSLVTFVLKVGLYSKSMLYTARPIRGTKEKVLSNCNEYVAELWLNTIAFELPNAILPWLLISYLSRLFLDSDPETNF